MSSPTELQRQLLDLQRVDTDSRRLQHRRATLPEQQALDEHTDTLTRVRTEFVAAREELTTLEQRQRRLEADVATVDARRKAEEGRMYSGLITSEKEVEALRNELGALRGRKNDLEDELLDVMERREELTGLVETLTVRHAELKERVATLTVERDVAATEIDSDLGSLAAERKAAAETLPERVRSAYESLRARKDGLAVSELQGRTCSGCHLELTAIELEETREDAARGLAHCPQCERMLVISGG